MQNQVITAEELNETVLKYKQRAVHFTLAAGTLFLMFQGWLYIASRLEAGENLTFQSIAASIPPVNHLAMLSHIFAVTLAYVVIMYILRK